MVFGKSNFSIDEFNYLYNPHLAKYLSAYTSLAYYSEKYSIVNALELHLFCTDQ